MTAHVADATAEIQLSRIATEAHADFAFRMGTRVFVVKPLDDHEGPDALRTELQGVTQRLGYPSRPTKVGSSHAVTHSSIPG